MEWMLRPLKRYAQFTGRARPKEYWMYILFLILCSIGLSIVESMLGLGQSTHWMMHDHWSAYTGVRHSGGPLIGLLALATFIPSLAVAVRRLHDTDRSGWWLLIGLIPLLGGLILLIFMISGGTRGPNRYGPDPFDEPGSL